MAQSETPDVNLARDILAGRRTLTVPDLITLAAGLREENQMGYARRISKVAQPLAPPELLSEIEIKLALATYKDSDLPIDERSKTAESILLQVISNDANLRVDQRQEALGILGAISKLRWSVYGHKDHLAKAAGYYRSGYQLGIASDSGYTAINTAFVLDMMGEAAPAAEASRIRSEIVATLPGLAHNNDSQEGKWWFECTLGEAYLGLRDFEKARTAVQKAAAQKPENWRLETAARQMAHIVRLQSKAAGIPPNRWQDAPGFAVLQDLLGGSAEAAISFFLGKAGLALSGGGFRASLYHIGVLARLAELDMLRHIEVISCVSGGSILGAYYYLELRHLLQTRPDAEITRDDYVRIVRNVEKGFLQGVQRNLRMRMFLEPGSNWKALTSRATTTDRLAGLYERELYSRVKDEVQPGRPRFIQDLKVHPAGLAEGAKFAPRYDNWRRVNKVPILILNTTVLNTCHNWQFTATYMGEAPLRSIDTKIDGNDRLRRMYYDEAPLQYRSQIRLGHAVAASACVPGLFDPLVLDRLYPGYTAKLVDGGVYDNQGAASLRDEDCTVLLISDACGQTGIDTEPTSERIGVSLRTNNVLMARVRQEQYQLLSALQDGGLLRGFAYVHLKKDLDSQPVDWIDCPDRSTPETNDPETTYGIRKDLQLLLAGIRTDLDAFSDAEADALMLSGYRMMSEEFESCIKGFPTVPAARAGWRFLAIAPLAVASDNDPKLNSLKTTLKVAHALALKPYHVSAAVKALTWILAATALALLVLLALSAPDRPVSLLRALEFIAAGAAAYGFAKLILSRVLRNPNPLWQVLLAIPLLLLGLPLTWIFTGILDPIYLRSGPKYR